MGQENFETKAKSQVFPDKLAIADQLRRAELRMQLGVASRGDLQIVLGLSDHTLRLWESRGLKVFRPGTREFLYIMSEIREFLSRRESFPGRSKAPKRSRK